MAGTLWLGEAMRSRHHLSLAFGLDDLRFTASYWYADVDFYELEARYGPLFMERVYFHITAFTANTLVSLQPTHLDLGPYARFYTPEFWDLWQKIVRGVWAQWRYEHNRPDYFGPELIPPQSAIRDPQSAIQIEPGPVPILSFCGGGKDSLVSMKLLESAGAPFSTLAYSMDVYGPSEHQYALIDRLLDSALPDGVSRHRVWGYDDLIDSPVLRLSPEHSCHALTAAETPCSVFLALPLALQHGYSYLCLGHERSADTGNLVWSRTGEEVNHQWGKSHEAERLLNGYIGSQLVENLSYFSILKPIYDVLIFNLLAQHPRSVPFTHSCNLRKPWCGRCPKCAYVWLNYMAYLPTPLVSRTFGAHGNLFDMPENRVWFRQMLGLEEHTPFECIGQVDEARLAFEMCRRKMLDGEAMRLFIEEVPPVDVPALLERYLHVNDAVDTLPPLVRDSVLGQMRSVADRARGILLTEPMYELTPA
jgi:UDP-N-acetyl-alpha-D-muramoyl-L-alanyl-L-glutamate epimerase